MTEYGDGFSDPEERVVPKATAGAQLRAAREKSEMTVEQVAQQTRVPIRHLKAIEASDFTSLPGRTYIIGFARSFADAVGVDPDRLVGQLGQELAASGAGGYRHEADRYEPVDPLRIPSRTLAWSAVAVLALLLAGYGIWRSSIAVDDPLAVSTPDEASTSAENGRAAAPATPTDGDAPSADGQVSLTATDDVWLRVYEEGGKRLYQNTLMKGERYDIPKDARQPLILTGRPEAFAVTIDGTPVAPLGIADRTIADVPVDAASLVARTVDR